MGDNGCAWFGQNPSGARVASAVTDSDFLQLFGMPVDIDNEWWGESENKGINIKHSR